MANAYWEDAKFRANQTFWSLTREQEARAWRRLTKQVRARGYLLAAGDKGCCTLTNIRKRLEKQMVPAGYVGGITLVDFTRISQQLDIIQICWFRRVTELLATK